MTEPPRTWTIEHFSQSSPEGPGQEDVPRLLRRLADTLEGMGEVAVEDVVFHSEVANDGSIWPSMTVYLHRPSQPA